MSKSVYLVTLFMSSVFMIANCDDPGVYDVHAVRPGHHHHHDPFYHHYLSIKVKIVLVLGAFFTFFMFAGKLFALIKYAEYAKEKPHYHEPEKVYVQPPVHYDHDFKSADLPEDFSQRIASDKFSRLRPRPTRYNTIPSKYMAGGRALESEAWGHFVESRKYDGINSIADGWEQFSGLIRRLNVTDIILNELKVVTTTCKKKFICKLDQFSNGNWALEASLKVLRDDVYVKYKTGNQTTEADCDTLYKDCSSAAK